MAEQLKASLREKAPVFGLQPKIHQNILDHASFRVKKDYTTKNIVLCTAISTYTSDPMNYFSRGVSSIGKTYNIMTMLSYFPKKDVWLLGGLSPTALVHDYGVLIDETGHKLDEDFMENRRDQLIEEARTTWRDESKKLSNEIREIRKQVKREWRERLKTSKYLVDLSNKILVFLENPHIETWMRIRPILSHDAREIEYKFTDKGGGGLRTKTVLLRGWPAVICCTTDQGYVEDLATRGFSGTPDQTPEKFGLANLVSGKQSARPWLFDLSKDQLFLTIQEYITRVKHALKNQQWQLVIPYAEELAEIFPAKVGRDMRDFKHFLTLIKMFTALHIFIRPRIEMDGETWVLSTTQDLISGLRVFQDLEETTKTFLPGHVLDFFHRVVLPLTEDKQTPFLEELMNTYNETAERKISSDSVYKYVTMLSQIGYVTKECNPDPEGDKRRKVVKRLYTPRNSRYSWIQQVPHFFTEKDLQAWLLDFANNWIGKPKSMRTFCLDEERQMYVSTQIPLNTVIETKDRIQTFFSLHFCVTKDQLKEARKSDKRPETRRIHQYPPIPASKDRIVDNQTLRRPCSSCRKIPLKLYPDESERFLICAECKRGESTKSLKQVKALRDLPELIGSDLKSYGPFTEGHVITLPIENADLMIKRGVAVEVDERGVI